MDSLCEIRSKERVPDGNVELELTWTKRSKRAGELRTQRDGHARLVRSTTCSRLANCTHTHCCRAHGHSEGGRGSHCLSRTARPPHSSPREPARSPRPWQPPAPAMSLGTVRRRRRIHRSTPYNTAVDVVELRRKFPWVCGESQSVRL